MDAKKFLSPNSGMAALSGRRLSVMAYKDSSEFQSFLDGSQYTGKNIRRYEKIYGNMFISHGGEETTAKFCRELDLRPGQKVLDIGCGVGGSAFYMARHYGADVFAIDLSQNMISIAKDYWNGQPSGIQHRVQFHIEDATKMAYPENFYDVVYSRDTVLHIFEKKQLFENLLKCLKPGGKLMISDYCRGEGEHTMGFRKYVKLRGYQLITINEYRKMLERVGFEDIEAKNNSAYFKQLLNDGLKTLKENKTDIVDEYSEEDYDYLCQNLTNQCGNVDRGDHVWGYFVARKMFD